MSAGNPIHITVKNDAAIKLFVYVYDRSQGAGAAPVFADHLDAGKTSDEIEIEYYEAFAKYSVRWLSQANGHADLAKTVDVTDGQTYKVAAGA